MDCLHLFQFSSHVFMFNLLIGVFKLEKESQKPKVRKRGFLIRSPVVCHELKCWSQWLLQGIYQLLHVIYLACKMHFWIYQLKLCLNISFAFDKLYLQCLLQPNRPDARLCLDWTFCEPALYSDWPAVTRAFCAACSG